MSNYGKIKDTNGKTTSQYNSADNIERKANRTSEIYEHVGQNKAAHVYTTTGSSIAQAHEANENAKRKANPAPVKVYTDEEKKAFVPKVKKSDDDVKYADLPTNCPGCKSEGLKLKGHTNDMGEPLTWWHCPSCETTGVKRLPENEDKIEKGCDGTLTKTHPQAYDIYVALQESKKVNSAFLAVHERLMKGKVQQEEPHDDKQHEAKERKAAKKIKAEAQKVLDLHEKEDK